MCFLSYIHILYAGEKHNLYLTCIFDRVYIFWRSLNLMIN